MLCDAVIDYIRPLSEQTTSSLKTVFSEVHNAMIKTVNPNTEVTGNFYELGSGRSQVSENPWPQNFIHSR